MATTSFTLHARPTNGETRTVGEEIAFDIDGADTVGTLKQKIIAAGFATRAAKVFIAHRGRALTNDEELCECLRDHPFVAMTSFKGRPGAEDRQHATTTRDRGDGIRREYLNLPNREQISNAWERFLPSGLAGRATDATDATFEQAAAAFRATAEAIVGNERSGAHPAAAAADVPVVEEEERTCRVCFCGEEAGPLLAPCRCKGSMRFVHHTCLNEWRSASANPKVRLGRRHPSPSGPF